MDIQKFKNLVDSIPEDLVQNAYNRVLVDASTPGIIFFALCIISLISSAIVRMHIKESSVDGYVIFATILATLGVVFFVLFILCATNIGYIQNNDMIRIITAYSKLIG